MARSSGGISLKSLLLSCAAAAGVAYALGAAAPVAAAGNGNSLHGAQAMGGQIAGLDKLLGKAPRLGPPSGVDPAFWKALVPEDNAETAARVALGKKLYFERRLSADGTVACATCHDVSRGFADARATSEGIRDQLGRRNAPTTMNAMFFQTLFWDGRASSLEDQAKMPIVNPIEMGQPDGAHAVAAIAGDAGYQKEFQAAYGRGVNYEDMGRAIGAFERTLVFLDAPFDRFFRGDAKAVSADARAGWVLFNGKGRCVTCHQFSSSNPVFTDSQFHNIGVAARHQNFEKLAGQALAALARDPSKESIDRLALGTDLSELGRFVVTRNRADIGAFKTPLLRNIGITAPYMHDGSMKTLWDVMDHYNKGGEANHFLDGGIEPLALSEKEIDQLVAFMFTLTDVRFAEQNARAEKKQHELARTQRPFRDNALSARKLLPFENRAEGKK